MIRGKRSLFAFMCWIVQWIREQMSHCNGSIKEKKMGATEGRAAKIKEQPGKMEKDRAGQVGLLQK